MALYSEAIETDSKWMWSSITSGTIGILFLMAAFWGLSSNISHNTPIYINDINVQAPISSTNTTKDTKKVELAQPVKPIVTPKLKNANIIAPNIKRSTKRNSTYAKLDIANKNNKATQQSQLIKTIAQADQAVAVTEPKVFKGTSAITPNKIDLSKLNALEKNNGSKNIQLSALNSDKQQIPKVTITPAPVDLQKKPFVKADKQIKVSRGDTLLKILKSNGATASEALAFVNKLKPHVKVHALEIGQPLTLTLQSRKKTKSIYPTRLILPLGYSPNNPEAILKDRIAVKYDANNKLVLDLPTNKLAAITMRPSKPLKAPKFTPSPKVIDKKSAADLTKTIAGLTKDNSTRNNISKAGKSKTVFYRTRSYVKGSFKKTIAAQRVPKDVQSRLLSVYNHAVKSKKIRSKDVLEVMYDQKESVTGRAISVGKLQYIAFKANGKSYAYYRYGNNFYDRYGNSANPVKGGFLTNPVPGARMTSKFGMRKHPITRRWRLHGGNDYAAPKGTPIYAAAAGKMTVAKWSGGFGRYIEVDHQNGYTTGYAHMIRFAKGMKAGKYVRKGQIIGYVGSTGLSTGNHLHFILKRGKKKIDSRSKMGNGGSSKLTGSKYKKFKKEMARIKSTLSRTKPVVRIANN